MSTRVTKRGREGCAVRSGSKLAINIPFVNGIAQRENVRGHCKRVGHGEGDRRVNTDRAGRISQLHITVKLKGRNFCAAQGVGFGRAFHHVIDCFHHPLVGEVSSRDGKHINRGGGIKGRTLVPLVAHRLRTGGASNRRHQVVRGGGGAGVGRTGQRDGEVHHRERMNRGDDENTVGGTHLDCKLVRLSVTKDIVFGRRKLVHLFVVSTRRSLSVHFPEVGDLAVQRTVNHRSEGDRLTRATRLVAYDRNRKDGVFSGGDIRGGCRHAGRCQKRLIGRWGYPTEQLQFPIVGMGCFAACLACSQVEERH